MILFPLLLIVSGFASAVQLANTGAPARAGAFGTFGGAAVVARVGGVDFPLGASLGSAAAYFVAPALRPFGPTASAAADDGPTPLQESLAPGQHWSPRADGRRDQRMGTGDELVHDGPRGRLLVSAASFDQPAEPADGRTSRASLDRRFDGAAARSSGEPALIVLDDALRAKVERELSPLRSVPGFLGYRVSSGESGHPTSYMRGPHVLVRMRHPRFLHDSPVEFPQRVAGLLVVFDFESNEGIQTITVDLTRKNIK